MIIDIFADSTDSSDIVRDHLATFTIKGLNEVANNEISRKENSTRPKITLSFELTRSGLI